MKFRAECDMVFSCTLEVEARDKGEMVDKIYDRQYQIVGLQLPAVAVQWIGRGIPVEEKDG